MCYQAFGLNIKSEIPLCNVIQSRGETDLEIKLGNFDLPEMEQTKFIRNFTPLAIGGTQQDFYLSWENLADFRCLDGKKIVVQAHSEDWRQLQFYLLAEALGVILLQRKFFLLHGCAVNVNGEAIAFIGTSGAGKSTTAAAFIRNGCAMLTDDMIAVTFDSSNQPWIIPAYPQSKIFQETAEKLGFQNFRLDFKNSLKVTVNSEAIFSPEPIPLKSIYWLQKDSDEPSQKLDVKTAFQVLGKNFSLPKMMMKSDWQIRHFEQCIKLANQIGVVKFNRPNGLDALQQFVQTMINGKHSLNYA